MQEQVEICIARNICNKFWSYRGYSDVDKLDDRHIMQMFEATKCITIKMHGGKIVAIVVGVHSEVANHIDDLRKVINALPAGAEKCILVVGKKFLDKSGSIPAARAAAAGKKIEIEIISHDAVSAVVPEHAEYAKMKFHVIPPNDESLALITKNVKNFSPISINDPLLIWRGDAIIGHVLVIDTPALTAGHTINYRYITN